MKLDFKCIKNTFVLKNFQFEWTIYIIEKSDFEAWYRSYTDTNNYLKFAGYIYPKI